MKKTFRPFQDGEATPALLRKDHRDDKRYIRVENDQAVHAVDGAEMVILPSTAYGYEKGKGILVECSNGACRYRTLLDKHHLYDLGLLGGASKI